MRLGICLALVVALAATATAIPSGWEMRERVASGSVKFVVAVKLKNVDELNRVLNSVSDPQSPAYGRHLSMDEVDAITSDWDATGNVFSWLLSQGVPSEGLSMTRSGGFITVEAPVAVAERVLSAPFHNFYHAGTKQSVVRSLRHNLPSHIDRHVDFVSSHSVWPSTAPGRSRKPLGLSVGAPVPAGYVTPALIQKAYSVPATKVASANSTSSVYESLGQNFSPEDLAAYQTQFNLEQVPVANIIGPNTDDCSSNPNSCGEADLDVQLLSAIAQGTPLTYWSIDQNDQTPFLDWIMAVSQASDAPLVHSISYGSIEIEEDPSTLKRFCDEVGKLGSRGITVLAASGDDGVANFVARNNQSACGFSPSFPATCPNVLAVGGTQGVEDSSPEVACTSNNGGEITTGGGFSTVFSQPSYQSSAVSNFLSSSSSLPPSSMFNGAGRGYPDVAAAAAKIFLILGGSANAEAGTSAACPIFAAILTQINGERLAAGKSALGFVNTAMYQADSSVFNQITSGENNCCAAGQSSPVCCQYGFTALSSGGWAPVTGLGSVNYDNLKSYLMDM